MRGWRAPKAPQGGAGAPGGGSRVGHGLCPPQLDSPQEEEALHGPLSVLGQELQRLLDIHWLGPIAHPAEEVGAQGLGSGIAQCLASGSCSTPPNLASHRKVPAVPTRAALSFASTSPSPGRRRTSCRSRRPTVHSQVKPAVCQGGTGGAVHPRKDAPLLTYPSSSCPRRAGGGQGSTWLPGDVTFVTQSPLQLFLISDMQSFPTP